MEEYSKLLRNKETSKFTANDEERLMQLHALFSKYGETDDLPSPLLSSETNKKLDEFKHVCVVMKDYGITDSDYWKALENRFCPNTRHKSMVEYAYSEKMVEALDLANYIEASDFKPYKSWLDRLFRNKQMDATLKAALNRILELYVMVTT